MFPHSSPHPLSILSNLFLPVPLLTSHLPLPRSPGRPLAPPCWTHPVLQPVPASGQVHVSGIPVIEAAFAELASEADHLPLLAAHLGQNTAQLPTRQP